MINQTSTQYDSIINSCKTIFLAKNKDYGTSWRIMRISSIMDQIFIKAQRIRTIEENEVKKVNEDVDSEYMGIINYCVIALIQLELKGSKKLELNSKTLSDLYDKYIHQTKSLMEEKNHDYGEAWRDMLVSTFTDMLLMRVLRIREITAAKGNTIMSEGIDANLMDMINYSIFALIHLQESKIKVLPPSKRKKK